MCSKANDTYGIIIHIIEQCKTNFPWINKNIVDYFRLVARQKGPILRRVKRQLLMMMTIKMADVKIMVMLLASEVCVHVCGVMCVCTCVVMFSPSKVFSHTVRED